ENIRKAGVSLLGIISDILDFSKIESGHMELVSERYELASAVSDLYNLVQFRAEAKGLELRFDIDPKLPSGLTGDEIRIKQIITNLLTNAVKYTEKGSVVLEAKCLEKTTDSVLIGISVTDTGSGIREDEIDRLFEPFDRLNLKKTRTIEGSGLGLAITRQILDMMDSTLEVDSTYGKGSRFSFSIRQKVSDDHPVGDIDIESLLHSGRGAKSKQSSFTAPGVRLLVVDDTPMNLQVIAGLLKRTLMDIDVAESGAECLEKFRANKYDLVFLDYRMPHMNGIETLAEIRRVYPDMYEHTPIISLTASAVSGDKEKMLRAGFTDYLPKPVNIDDMERMLIKYLPKDSVVITEDTAVTTTDEDEDEDDELSKLPEIIFEFEELDPKKGIGYCGDADDYIYALETYAESIDSKSEQIEAALKSGDHEAYTINVHSLKSTSQAIGAMRLYEMAKALEQAGKDRDDVTMQKDTPVMMRAYREIKEVLQRIVESAEG
ncbi:MAG: response regulator, partial [Lachnospiraceae bacterium]|nr:response regulator [Lachnospiraceae bacterium]